MADPLHEKNYEIFRLMLAEARMAKRMQQGELALLLKKPQSYVSKSENGGRRLDFSEFVNFADALGIDVEQFLAQYRERIANVSSEEIQSATNPQPKWKWSGRDKKS